MIEIRNINKTRLNRIALIKVIKKFSHIKRNVLISFDGRLKAYGDYFYSAVDKRHEIRVSLKKYHFKNPQGRVVEMIGTILHELEHAQQQEAFGTLVFMSKKFSANKNIKSQSASDYFSVRECSARLYEEKNILRAAEYYWKTCSGAV